MELQLLLLKKNVMPLKKKKQKRRKNWGEKKERETAQPGSYSSSKPAINVLRKSNEEKVKWKKMGRGSKERQRQVEKMRSCCAQPEGRLKRRASERGKERERESSRLELAKSNWQVVSNTVGAQKTAIPSLMNDKLALNRLTNSSRLDAQADGRQRSFFSRNPEQIHSSEMFRYSHIPEMQKARNPTRKTSERERNKYREESSIETPTRTVTSQLVPYTSKLVVVVLLYFTFVRIKEEGNKKRKNRRDPIKGLSKYSVRQT